MFVNIKTRNQKNSIFLLGYYGISLIIMEKSTLIKEKFCMILKKIKFEPKM